MFRLTEVVKQLLIINVLFFIAKMAYNADIFTVIDMNSLALFYPGSEYFRPYQIVTHFFMHGNTMHILFNMFALVMFGSALEQIWGSRRFLVYYLVCALGAALVHVLSIYFDVSTIDGMINLFQTSPSEGYSALLDSRMYRSLPENGQAYLVEIGNALAENQKGAVAIAGEQLNQLKGLYSNQSAVGASGAIYGLLVAFGMLFPNVELMLLFFPVPIKAKYFIPILMVGEFFMGFRQFSWDNTAHFAHLGGALFGFLMVMYWKKTGVGIR